MLTIQSCNNGPQFVVSESDLQKMQQPLQQMMGMMHFRGPSVSESYLGRKASVTPASLTFPGSMLLPPTAGDLTLDLMMKEIYDERNGRCVMIGYPDSEAGRRVSSTLNITDPSF